MANELDMLMRGEQLPDLPVEEPVQVPQAEEDSQRRTSQSVRARSLASRLSTALESSRADRHHKKMAQARPVRYRSGLFLLPINHGLEALSLYTSPAGARNLLNIRSPDVSAWNGGVRDFRVSPRGRYRYRIAIDFLAVDASIAIR